MQLRLQIVLGNDGMLTGEDLADALERVAANVREYYESAAVHEPTHPAKILDRNGQGVGGWKIEETR